MYLAVLVTRLTLWQYSNIYSSICCIYILILMVCSWLIKYANISLSPLITRRFLCGFSYWPDFGAYLVLLSPRFMIFCGCCCWTINLWVKVLLFCMHNLLLLLQQDKEKPLSSFSRHKGSWTYLTNVRVIFYSFYSCWRRVPYLHIDLQCHMWHCPM